MNGTSLRWLCIPSLVLGSGLATAARADLIPLPEGLTYREGELSLDESTRIALSPASAEIRRIADGWAAPLRRSSGLGLPIVEGPVTPEAKGVVRFVVTGRSGEGDGELFGDESYRLVVTADGATVTAPRPAGLFYGGVTLAQLLPPGAQVEGSGAAFRIPAVEIADRPRFRWRGMHLDVARHFMPVEFVKKYVDLLSRYKLNTFHWHLTEDQGWRIEIKRYPKLTEVAAFRRETQVKKNRDPYVGDGVRHGGFYTQDEVREVVAYAAERYVRVVPEIEMPGHAQAALAAYPELGCDTPQERGPIEVSTRWGVHEDVFCPSERTFTFLENVLAEVIELFPSPYVHIGGDEVPKTRWRESEVAQAVMRRHELADEAELQSWFIRRIESFLRRHGRRLIGWDEILEGGLAPEATVMSWRGMDGGIEAARQGHDVIMTPSSHVYFDHYQADPAGEPLAIGGFTPLKKVYAFEPVPSALDDGRARHVLGAQANVWTEYIKTPEHVEYMAFPRLLALAEVVWSPRRARHWKDFRERLESHLGRLDALEVGYRPPSR